MKQTGNILFDSAPTFTIKIALYDIAHFDTEVILMEAKKQNVLPPDTEGLAHHLIGFEYIGNQPHLIFECKAFTDASEMYENMPDHWAGTND